ncbi:CotH kinase family protein [Clostridium sp. DL1XJH146]
MKMKFSLILIIISLFFTSCSTNSFSSNTNSQENIIEDNKEVYTNDDGSIVKEVYITVLPVDKSKDKYAYTFSELNTYDPDSNANEPEVKVLFKEGHDGVITTGDYGYGLTTSNGTMELRGQSSRLADLKSYKVNLDENSLWDGFETVNLNKHPFDDLRIRNKLSFDLIKSVPNITSLRTSFINVYIKDLSEGNYANDFEDFGLFTQIENVDTDFLENHDLDKKGSLYKVENFEFYRYEDTLKLKDDPDYNEEDFEKILEIKGNEDHEKLLEMLDAVNNDFIHINDVFDKYFNRDNYLTWLATNILFDNLDTSSRNYFIYSPSDSDTWFFLPWDYDKGLGGYRSTRAIWQEGVSNHWGNVLTNRFLRNEDNVQALTDKIEEISQIITKDKLVDLADLYKPIALEFLSREPDNGNGAVNIDEVNLEFDALIETLDNNKDNYYESLEKPMPVFMGDPVIITNYIQFQWTDSYDFQGDTFTYSVDISDTPTFDTILYSETNITENEIIIDMLPSGTYYWRLFILDSNGNKMDAFDIYIITDDIHPHFGTKIFYIS